MFLKKKTAELYGCYETYEIWDDPRTEEDTTLRKMLMESLVI